LIKFSTDCDLCIQMRMKRFILRKVKWEIEDTQFESEIQTYKKMLKLVSFDERKDPKEESNKANSMISKLESLEERWKEIKDEISQVSDFINKHSSGIVNLNKFW
jgi:DNA-binding transcriptional regulator GbsR (MarR family)